ncbi:helix-turn-helix domain-containing protein [Paenibacillus sp. FSL R7-0302]|uniref:helix-turn-helix domain-containing protein n=1 Tax=Paenibacillus sp. FSL R7-0302 TaxID=2921681 RepID=UPI0030FB7AD4
MEALNLSLPHLFSEFTVLKERFFVVLTRKTGVPYWKEFAEFQTFTSVEEMVDTVKSVCSEYCLTETIKAVLNTIKLHAKNFVGVCWLYREEIAKKAKVSLSSVKRAIKELKDAGIISVITKMHTKRGGQTHNLYVINNPVDIVDNIAKEPAIEPAAEPRNEPPQQSVQESSTPCPASDSAVQVLAYKNCHNNSHKNPNKLQNIKTFNSIKIEKENEHVNILANVPDEFVKIMEPYYGDSPEIILNRWKTTCVAIKKSCFHIGNTSWETIRQAWKTTINRYKRSKIKNETDDGLGGFYYRVLCEEATADYLVSDEYQAFCGNR